MAQCPFFGIFVQKLFFIQKAVNLSSKSLLALTKQVSTCFEDFMNISWFYLIKVKFSGHFWPYTLSAPSCTWFLMIGMLVGLKLFIISWVWVLALLEDKCAILIKFVIHIMKALDISYWKMQEKVEIITNSILDKNTQKRILWRARNITPGV